MDTSIRIEQVGLESFEVVFHLLQRFFSEEGFKTREEHMRVSLHALIEDANSAVLLAWCDSEALGVATVTVSVSVEYRLAAELGDLYVLPHGRSRGVASALIEAVCAWSLRRGCSQVLVTVTPEGEANHGLTRFYEKRRFMYTGRILLSRALAPNS